MKKILILLFMLFLTINYAIPADWQINEKYGFIDKSSILKNGDSVKAWIMFFGSGKIKNKKYSYTKQYQEANCSEKTMATLDIVYFSKKDKVIDSYNFENIEKSVNFHRIVPDSLGEAILNDMCGTK